MEKTALQPKAKRTVDRFLQALRTAYPSGLESVAVYGSALSEDFNDRISNINVLVVLVDTSLENLKKISAALKKPAFAIIEPVFFTQDHIRRSLDVFPIEFLDILDRREVIFGDDIFRGLAVNHTHLRRQCEQELKAKLIVLKSTFPRARTGGELKSLLLRSFTSYIHIARNLLRLKGRQPSYRKGDVIRDLKTHFSVDTGVLEKLLELKMKNLKLSYDKAESLLFDFVKHLDIIAEIADAF